jgi:putative transposase
MARIARIVVPNFPHHVVQKGNRRQNVFFSENDKSLYINLLRKHGQREGLKYWAYCLMDNHVHIVAVPNKETSLAQGIGKADREYSLLINSREGWRGYLWQGRFMSYPMDDNYLFNAIRYIERNPVRAGLVKQAEAYPWSSARTHVYCSHDPLVSEIPLCLHIDNWTEYLKYPDDQAVMRAFARHAKTGRPLGGDTFIVELEKITGRVFRKMRPGPRPKSQSKR